ncbi:uncharacterized protein [Ptychodera flava]|uniref:uncharacterized protein isoform X2 n=1 Tax=Ptychodera flava TaxID=63121 RepID=UPI00396A207F
MAFFEGVVRHETHFTIAIWFILYFFTSLALSYIFSYVLLHIIGWRDVPGQRWTKCGYVILFRMFLGDVGTVELQIARFVSNNLLASKYDPQLGRVDCGDVLLRGLTSMNRSSKLLNLIPGVNSHHQPYM